MTEDMRTAARRYLLRLWESRGGGFYGFVTALTFLYLEAISLASDFVGPQPFNIGWWIGWVVSNFFEALVNSVRAAIWPLTWVGTFGIGLRSAALLGTAYVAYRAVRPAVLRFLRAGEDDAAPRQPSAAASAGSTTPSEPSTLAAATPSARVGPRFTIAIGRVSRSARSTKRRPE